ncbi:hypothetical protein WOB88_12070, partial [Vibrio parahaemolyticus]
RKLSVSQSHAWGSESFPFFRRFSVLNPLSLKGMQTKRSTGNHIEIMILFASIFLAGLSPITISIMADSLPPVLSL